MMRTSLFYNAFTGVAYGNSSRGRRDSPGSAWFTGVGMVSLGIVLPGRHGSPGLAVSKVQAGT